MRTKGIAITGSYCRETWEGKPQRHLTILAYDAETGKCVEVCLNNVEVVRLRRSIAALDKKADAIEARTKKRLAKKKAKK